MADESETPKTPRPVRRVGGVPVARLVVAGVALVYGIIFIVLNTGRVRIHFVFFTVSTRLWVGLLVCLAAGALLGQAIGTYRKRSTRSRRPPS
jgi:uncharacterized integral membrane protein